MELTRSCGSDLDCLRFAILFLAHRAQFLVSPPWHETSGIELPSLVAQFISTVGSSMRQSWGQDVVFASHGGTWTPLQKSSSRMRLSEPASKCSQEPASARRFGRWIGRRQYYDSNLRLVHHRWDTREPIELLHFCDPFAEHESITRQSHVRTDGREKNRWTGDMKKKVAVPRRGFVGSAVVPTGFAYD